MNSSLFRTSPKYQQVLEILKQEILSGRYQIGEKIASEIEMVKRFGTSRITIGRALRELGRQGMVERRAGSGTYVRPSRNAGLTFGLVIPHSGMDDIFSLICQGMADAAQHGRHALWGGHAPETPDRCQQAWQLTMQSIERQVSGVFFAPLDLNSDGDAMNRQIIAALSAARIPIILLDRCYLPHPLRSSCDLVGIDNRRAASLATEHLLNCGSKRLVFLARHKAVPTVEARIAGFRETLFSRPAEVSVVVRIDEADQTAVKAMLEQHAPDAVVCANDRTAGGLMHSLKALGFDVPRRIRVVGMDDAGYAELLPVPLTTVRQPCREIGVTAMHAMLERLAHPHMPARDILLAATLTLRESA
ncbi:MAG: Ribose operon repressor [Verrucomicrobiales bacterium]|nr:Ribose operon repressor [Verrucomicrobiales bacterium]